MMIYRLIQIVQKIINHRHRFRVISKPTPIALHLIFLTVISLLLFFPEGAVLAHAVDMYAQNQSIFITKDGLQVDWKITPGPLIADGIWKGTDQNQDGTISPEEVQVWSAPVLSQWVVNLDGQPISQTVTQNIHWPAMIDAFRTGEDSIQIHLFYKWSAGLTGKHLLEIHNSFQEANSLNWFSLTGKDAFLFDEPGQTSGQLPMNIYFPETTGGGVTGPASALTSWDSGKPHLPGFSDIVSNLAVNLSDSQPSQQQATGPSSPRAALVSLVRTQEFSPWFLIGAFLLSLTLGSLHALTPGHGKTLVAAYLIGSQGKHRDAIFLGLVVTLTHTGSVLLMGLITLLASRYILPELIMPWLEITSGLLVVVFGINLFLQRRADLSAWLVSKRQKKSAKKSYQLSPGATFSLQNTNIVTPYLYRTEPHYKNDGHSHDGMSHQHGGHEHTHALPSNQVTLKSLITMGISGGLVPCPDAIAILLVAVAINRVLFGMGLIIAFSFGLALVLIVIGIAMVQGARFIERSDFLTRFSIFTPVISAVVVFGLGVGLTFTALNSFTLATTALQSDQSSSSQAPSSATLFDIKQAKLVYLYPDSQRQNQLAMVPLAGGNPVSYTQESAGLARYAVSPDRKTIIYTIIKMDGTSSLWAIDADGSHKRVVLDCLHAECVGPIWFPGGQKLVYERLNYVENSAALSVFSIWWLDLKTGDTKPVFQDQAFSSYNPEFSPDGQWLSYISPSSNTIELNNLKEVRNISIPLPRGPQPRMIQAWNPTSSSILFWGNDEGSTMLRLKRYDLASGKIINLSGSNNQWEFETAWSPNGQWIAIVRDSSSPASAKHLQQIWLVKPDGTQGHPVVDEGGFSYSDISWSPDNNFLAYSRYSTQVVGKPEIWFVDIRTGEKTKVISGGSLPVLLP